MKCYKVKKFAHETKKLKSLADILLGLSVDGMARLMKIGELYEVNEHV